jgi:multiple sugar transport system permease protein
MSMANSGDRRGPVSSLLQNNNVLGFLFMLPAAVFLVCFLTYPLGLGVWLGFTDTRIGRDGVFIGLENYEFLMDDSVFWLSVFNTILYTSVASVLKFALGLWLAMLLNQHLPFKAFFRAIVLLPWVVPTVLSALAFWWIYDAQFSIISWSLMKLGWIERTDQLPRRPDQRAHIGHRRQCLARHSLRGDLAACRPADDPGVAATRQPPSTAPRAGSVSAM